MGNIFKSCTYKIQETEPIGQKTNFPSPKIQKTMINYKKTLFLLSAVIPSILLAGYSVSAIKGIQEYDHARDYEIISRLLVDNKKNFPDADLCSDLDSAQVQMSIPTQNGSMTVEFKQKIFVYCVDNQPVGFVRVFDMGSGAGMVAQLAIKEENQRQGIGQKLLSQAVDWLKSQGSKMITLASMADNPGAHKLYEKVGFKKEVDLGDQYLFIMHQV